WYFMECSLDDQDRLRFKLSEPVVVVYKDENVENMVRKTLGHIAWLLEEVQKPDSDSREERVIKKHRSSSNLAENAKSQIISHPTVGYAIHALPSSISTADLLRDRIRGIKRVKKKARYAHQGPVKLDKSTPHFAGPLWASQILNIATLLNIHFIWVG
ncbi:2105_t:CDS:2, partial [Ambispora leptoticha]